MDGSYSAREEAATQSGKDQVSVGFVFSLLVFFLIDDKVVCSVVSFLVNSLIDPSQMS